MNAFNGYFNPMDAITQGYDLGDRFSRTQRESQALRDEEAMRAAYKQMGQGDFLTGFDGVPGATRPDYLKQLYATNPQAAVQMEGQIAAPYALERDIQKAGKIEEAKKRADAAVWNGLLEKYFPAGMPGGAAPTAADGAPDALPPGPWSPETMDQRNALAARLMPGAPASGGASSAPSPLERSFELGPQGPKFAVKTPSDLDVQAKRAEIAAKEGGLKVDQEDLARKQLRDKTDASQSDREFTRQSAKDVDEEVNRINEQMRQNRQMIRDANKLPPDQAEQEIASLKTENRELAKRRDGLLKGKIAPQPKAAASVAGSDTPTAAPVAPAAAKQPSMLPNPRTTATQPATAAQGEAPAQAQPAQPQSLLSKEQQMGVELKDREQKVTMANKDIDAARDDASRILQYGPQMKQLFEMASSGLYGNPKLGNVPGGLTALKMFSSKNADFDKLRDTITNLFIKPGQSQLINTLPERQMMSAAVPSLDASPQQNQKNAVSLMNFYHSMEHYPSFLEQWAKQHGGTLEGASDAWGDYIKHNPRYSYTEDKRGNVTVSGSRAVLSPKQWMQYRDRNAVDVWMDKEGQRHIYLKQPTGEVVQYEGPAGKIAHEVDE